MIILSLDSFFEIIRNGAWISIDELSDQLAIPITKLDELSKFFSNNGFIIYEENNRRIKIKPPWALLLPEEQPEE